MAKLCEGITGGHEEEEEEEEVKLLVLYNERWEGGCYLHAREEVRFLTEQSRKPGAQDAVVRMRSERSGDLA